MAEAPPPSDIPNVFGMNEPQHMLTKLYVELHDLSTSFQSGQRASHSRGHYLSPGTPQ